MATGVLPMTCTHCLARALLGVGKEAPPVAESEPVLLHLGNYELTEELARGGMGIVFRARQTTLDRPVAVKLLRDGVWAKPEDVERFRAEAASAGQLHHPNIVRIHEVGEVDGHHFIAMDLVEGRNLEDVTRSGPLPPMAAAGLVLTLAEAIQHAHQRGVLHRDLKPSNVLLDAAGEPYVTDFGLARALDGQSSMTLSGETLGTPGYMAPEQATGESDVGPTADVYGLGAVLYHLLTGGPPFCGASAVEIVRCVLESDPISPKLRNPQVPEDLSAICLKCLEKAPRRRYASAADLAEDLGRCLRGESTVARPPGWLELGCRWVRRHSVEAALVGALAVVVAGGFAGMLWQWRKAVVAGNAARESERLQREQVFALNKQKAETVRSSGRPGQRIEALVAIAAATADRVVPELRDDAIGALLLPDLGRRLWWVEKADDEHPWCFDPDLDHYVPNNSARRLVVVDAASHRIAADFGVMDSQVAAACFSPDGRLLAVRLDDGRIRLWEWRSKRTLPAPDRPGADRMWGRRVFDFSPDGQFLYYAPVGGGVHRMELATGRSQAIKTGGDVAMVRVSPNGRELVVVDGVEVELWQTDPPGLVRETEIRSVSGSTVLEATWHPGGDLVALGGAGYVWLWQCRTDGRVALAHAEAGNVHQLCFNSTGELLCGSNSIWDVASQARLLDLLVPAGNIIALSRDNRRIACQRVRNGFGVWEFIPPVGTGGLMLDPTQSNQWANAVTDVSPDGRWVVSVHGDGWRLWEGGSARVAAHLSEAAFAVGFAEEGRALIAVGPQGVRRWPLETGTPANLAGLPRVGTPGARLEAGGELGEARAGCIAAGGRFAAVSDGKSVVVWEVDSGNRRVPFGNLLGGNLLDLSADGRWLAINRNGSAGPVLIDAATGQSQPFESGILSAACQFDRYTGDLALWNSAEYAFLRTGTWERGAGKRWLPSIHSNGLLAGGFSPDGRLMVASTDDQVTSLVDRISGQRIARFDRPGKFWGHTVAVDPTFRRLYLSNHRGAIRVLDLRALRSELALLKLDWNDAAPTEAGAARPAKPN